MAASGAALAQSEPTALVDQQHCMFCHTRDAPFLAPSFQQIAERYRGVPNASVMLEHKLRLGGKAHWGDMAMPLPADLQAFLGRLRNAGGKPPAKEHADADSDPVDR